MERLLTNITASLTELRDTKKLIEQSGGKPVAILNRNQLEGYFVPAAAVGKVNFEPAEHADVMTAMKRRKSKLQPTLKYLQDK
ncbi:MAG: hypothetical protein JKY67_13635 [Pseudomonadales bacterium]|nr:hypothetical protein [Pseudomonadales bacterium]